MIDQKFNDEKLQEIYVTEYTKEIAKLDAQEKKKNKKSGWRVLFYLCLFSMLMFYLWKSFSTL